MQQIVNFFIRNKNFLLFLLLLFISLVLTIQSHSYHKSKFISSTNFLSGGVYDWSYNITKYFKLADYNKRLLSENAYLRNQLHLLDTDTVQQYIDTASFGRPFTFSKALVIRNDYNKIDNYILIDKGKKDSVHADMGVVTDKGIIGIVEQTSNHYSRVISILNSNSEINAGLKKTNHYGTLTWDGKDPNIVQLEAIPRQAPIKKGDSIITAGYSTIFPKGIGIGTIEDFDLDQNNSYYNINVKLHNDMTNIGFVYTIKNNNRKEIESLLIEGETN